MAKRTKTRRTLEEILASTSDSLFPSELGAAVVSVDSTDCEGDTPLHVMVRRGDLHAVQELIGAGANVNAVGDMGETPLHIATGQGNLGIIEFLMGSGANAEIRSEFNKTPFEVAMGKGGEVAKLLRRLRNA